MREKSSFLFGRSRDVPRLHSAVYVAGIAIVGLCVAVVGDHALTLGGRAAPYVAAALDAASRDRPEVHDVVAISQVLSDEAWVESLRSKNYWSDLKAKKSSGGWSGNNAQASKLGASNSHAVPSQSLWTSSGSADQSNRWKKSSDGGDGPGSPWYHGDGEHYATLCVRLCDGSYTPVSFSTTSDNFDRDEKACKASCGSPAKLYIHPTPSGSVDTMEDLKGQPYTKLKTAFLFRTTYDQACRCKPEPWEQASLDRHLTYALGDKAKKGSKQAAAELKSLRQDMAKPVSARVISQQSANISALDVAANENKKPMVFGPAQIRVAAVAETNSAPLNLSGLTGQAAGPGFRAAQSDDPLAAAQLPRAMVTVATTGPIEDNARQNNGEGGTSSAKAKIDESKARKSGNLRSKSRTSARLGSSNAAGRKTNNAQGPGIMRLGAGSNSNSQASPIIKTSSIAGDSSWKSKIFDNRN